ncbi:MAG TPA: hypothetical protein VIN59_04135 [Alphaproteobacteria bacterium]
MPIRVLLLTLIAAFILPAVAAAQAEPPLPAPLQTQRAAGAQIYYLGKYDTLDGWVMIRAGKPEFYYATPNSGAIVLGILFDKDGKMLTPNQMIALQQGRKDDILNMVTPAMPAPDASVIAPTPETPATPTLTPEQQPQTPAPVAQAPAAQTSAQAATSTTTTPSATSPSERLLASMQVAPALVWGDASKPTFYAFLDPSCKHCQQFLREVEPFVLAGRVAVRMVMVGYNEVSMQQAAFLLAASDGADRMVRHAKGDPTAIEASGADVSAVAKNVELMSAWNLMGTPIILYRGASDRQVRMVRGRPYDVPAAVTDLAGPAPAQ